MFDSVRQSWSRTLSSEELGGRLSNAGAMGKLLVCVALVALAISFCTTSLGFYRIFPGDKLWWLLPLALALAFGFIIQAVLAASSWLLGADIGRYVSKLKGHPTDERTGSVAVFRVLVTLALFFPTLFLSIFLSFNTYFNGLYHGREEDRLQKARVPPFVGEVLSDLKRQVDAARTDATSALRGQVLDKWLPQLIEVANQATRAETAIQTALKEEAKARRKKIEERVREQQELDAQIKDAKRKKEEADKVINEDLPSKIAAAEREKDELNARVQAAQAKRDSAQRRLWIRVKQKDGTIKRVKSTKVAKELAESKRELAEATRARDSNDREIAAWRRKDENAKKERAEAVGRLETTPEGDSAQNPAPPREEIIPWHDVQSAVASLKAYATELEKAPNVKAYNQAVDTCSALVKELRKREATAKFVENVKCDPEALASMQKYDEMEKFRRSFDDKCYTVARDEQRTFDAALEFAAKCRTTAQQGGATAITATNQMIREFEESYATDRSEYSKTMSAFSLSFQMALLAIIVSLVQDLVLLGASIFVEIVRWQRRHEEMTEQVVGEGGVTVEQGDPANVQCAKIVLGDVRPTSDNPPLFAFDTESDRFARLPLEQQGNVRNGLAGLVQQRLASVPQNSSGRGTIYHITGSGLFELRRILRSYAAAKSESEAVHAQPAPSARRPAAQGPKARPAAIGGDRGISTSPDAFAPDQVSPTRSFTRYGDAAEPPQTRGEEQIFTPVELWRQERPLIGSYIASASDQLETYWAPAAANDRGEPRHSERESATAWDASEANDDFWRGTSAGTGSARADQHWAQPDEGLGVQARQPRSASGADRAADRPAPNSSRDRDVSDDTRHRGGDTGPGDASRRFSLDELRGFDKARAPRTR